MEQMKVRMRRAYYFWDPIINSTYQVMSDHVMLSILTSLTMRYTRSYYARYFVFAYHAFTKDLGLELVQRPAHRHLPTSHM